MPTFSGGYIEPGTYVTIKDAVIPSIPAGALVAAFTGTGKANKTILKEKVTLSKADANSGYVGTLSTIPIVGLLQENSVDYVLDAYGRKRYVTENVSDTPTTVFTVDKTAGTITWATTAGVVQPQEAPGNETVSYPMTRTIYVSYEVAKTATDKLPIGFDSLARVIETYGLADDDGDGLIENTLSLAAQIFFENGGSYLYCVQVDEDALADHQAAIDKLQNVDAYCVVPLLETDGTKDTGLINYIKTHVELMSSTVEKKERLGLLAGQQATELVSNPTDTAVATHITAIQACNHARLGYIVPAKVTKAMSTGDVSLPGCYIAAAVAGIITRSTTTSGEPISGKPLAGFSSIADRYTRYQKNKMASYGGLVIEDDNGNINIRHALSTKVGDAVTAELKITRIKDTIARLMRSSLNALFINKRNTGPEFLADVSTAVTMILDGVVALRDINSYENLQVTQNSLEPRQIDVAFQIKPTWDSNWISVTFGVAI